MRAVSTRSAARPAPIRRISVRRSPKRQGGFDWEALTTPSSGQQPLYQDEPKKPAGFDEEEFLRGAKPPIPV